MHSVRFSNSRELTYSSLESPNYVLFIFSRSSPSNQFYHNLPKKALPVIGFSKIQEHQWVFLDCILDVILDIRDLGLDCIMDTFLVSFVFSGCTTLPCRTAGFTKTCWGKNHIRNQRSNGSIVLWLHHSALQAFRLCKSNYKTNGVTDIYY